jgi:Sigma-54 interaction domain
MAIRTRDTVIISFRQRPEAQEKSKPRRASVARSTAWEIRRAAGRSGVSRVRSRRAISISPSYCAARKRTCSEESIAVQAIWSCSPRISTSTLPQAMLLRALEEKTFLPLGSDREAHSDFQLIAGTNQDLFAAVREGRFREDLLARINLWTFSLPGLRSRPEDIEPNLQFELEQFETRTSHHVTFSKEAREKLWQFALSPASSWTRNFRDLNAAVVRRATLAQGGRISTEIVEEEIERLNASWASLEGEASVGILSRLLNRAGTGQKRRIRFLQSRFRTTVC